MSGVSVLGVVLAIIALTPDDWAYNLASWRTFFLVFGVAVLTISLSFLAGKKFADKRNSEISASNDRSIIAFNSRTDIMLKSMLATELNSTKSLTVMGVACDEISKQSENFWHDFFIERDGKLKMIYLDPNGVQVGLRETLVCGRDNGEFADSVRYNLRIVFENINKLENRINSAIRAEVKVNDFAPSISCIITDNYVFVHHYGSSVRGMNMPICVITKGKNEINDRVYSFYVSMLTEILSKSSICLKEDYYGVQAISR